MLLDLMLTGCQVQGRGFKSLTSHFTDEKTEVPKPACGPAANSGTAQSCHPSDSKFSAVNHHGVLESFPS